MGFGFTGGICIGFSSYFFYLSFVTPGSFGSALGGPETVGRLNPSSSSLSSSKVFLLSLVCSCGFFAIGGIGLLVLKAEGRLPPPKAKPTMKKTLAFADEDSDGSEDDFVKIPPMPK